MDKILADTEIMDLQNTAMHSLYIVNDGNFEPVAHAVFRNDVILRNMFCFVNVETLKQCRQVNKAWKDISEPIFRRKSQVICSGRQTPKRFLSYITENNINLQCGHYKFYKTRLSLSNGLAILEKDFYTLSSLTLVDTIMVDDCGEKMSSFDLSSLLGRQLKKLVVSNPIKGGTKMIIKQEKLVGLDYLHLHNCLIDLKCEGRNNFCSTPKYIQLKGISFQTGGLKLEEDVTINDFIDISRAKEINMYNFQHPGKVLLHLLGPNENTVDYIQLDGVALTTTRDFKLKFFNIHDGNFEILYLPLSLEKLSIYHNWNMEENFILPNLRYLDCSMTKWFPLNLSLFSQCSNLSSVKLRGILFCDQVECNLSLLPPSVETLILINIKAKFDDQVTVRSLKLLVIFQCSAPCVYNVLKRFRADNVAIGPNYYDIHPKKISQLCIQIIHERLFRERLIFGGLHWEYDDFDFSGLLEFVDKESNCYSFKGTRGKAIDSFPFSKLIPGGKDDDLEFKNESYDIMQIFNNT